MSRGPTSVSLIFRYQSIFIDFYSYFVIIIIISLSSRPRDHGVIQFLSKGTLDSSPNVFFALGVYKCAC